MMNMFEIATREKYRFPFKGLCSVEDLWDLKLQDLDSIFKTLNAQKKQANEESLLATKSKEDKELETKIDIIKHIVVTKQQEALAKLQEKEIADKKQKLLKLKEQKQDEALGNMSIEEIDKMLESLG